MKYSLGSQRHFSAVSAAELFCQVTTVAGDTLR